MILAFNDEIVRPLFCSVLFYSILFCSVLFCSVLFCFAFLYCLLLLLNILNILSSLRVDFTIVEEFEVKMGR